MDLLNEKVEHISFGSGTVLELKDNRVRVRFKKEIGERTFSYPEAFKKFLKAENPLTENSISEELRVKEERFKMEIAAEEERKLELALETPKKKVSATTKRKKA